MTAVSGIGGVGIGEDDYDDTRYLPQPSPLARTGARFPDLPAQVQNLLGDYVTRGARLSR